MVRLPVREVTVRVLLLSVVMYFCRDSLRFASSKSNLFVGSLFIISKRVFLRMGFSFSPRTLNSPILDGKYSEGFGYLQSI